MARQVKKTASATGTMEFHSIRGTQGGRDFYAISCDFGTIINRFIYEKMRGEVLGVSVPKLRTRQIRSISSYMVENRDGYVLAPITVAVDGACTFSSSEGDIGRLSVPTSARIVVTDGKHRCAAIGDACSRDGDFYSDRVSVVMYEDKGLKNYLKMSDDIKQVSSSPTRSAKLLYDHRDTFSRFIVTLASDVPAFDGRTDMKNTTLSNRTTNFITLNGLAQATRYLLGSTDTGSMSSKAQKTAARYWMLLSKTIPEWKRLSTGDVHPADLRSKYVHAHTTVLGSLGLAGSVILMDEKWEEKIRRIGRIDWRRSNPAWEGKVVENGKILRTRISIKKGAIEILDQLGIRKGLPSIV